MTDAEINQLIEKLQNIGVEVEQYVVPTLQNPSAYSYEAWSCVRQLQNIVRAYANSRPADDTAINSEGAE